MAYLRTTVGDVEYGAEMMRWGAASGLFHRGRDGSWVQDRGTSQTPTFTDERDFRRWLLRQLREMAVAMGERPRGGKRPGAGAPRTTGSSIGPPVSFRLSAADRARAIAAAMADGISVNALARHALLAALGGSVSS